MTATTTDELRELLDLADDMMTTPGPHAPERAWDEWYEARDKLRDRIGAALEPPPAPAVSLSDARFDVLKALYDDIIQWVLNHGGRAGLFKVDEHSQRYVDAFKALRVPDPGVLTGNEGEVVFVPVEEPVDTVTQARSRALAEGHNCTSLEYDRVEMLPIPEHFVELNDEATWWMVKPGTRGARRFWRFRV